MDCLPLGKHVVFVPIILFALHLAYSAPFGRFQGSRGFLPVNPMFTSAPVYRQFIPFQGQIFNSWTGRQFYFTRPPVRQIPNSVVGNRFQNNFRQPVNVNERVNSPSAFQSRFRSFRRTYNSPTIKPPYVPLITRAPSLPPKKISVVSGPLNKVIPHPKRRNMKAKRRLRYRLVAKAKSFPGILKDTSLDTTKVRIQQNKNI